MISGMIATYATVESNSLQLFVSEEDQRDLDLRQIKILVDEWLMLREESAPDLRAIRVKERRLHDAIKLSGVYGMILNFAGLNIWVDDRSPDGVVQSQEAINL